MFLVLTNQEREAAGFKLSTSDSTESWFKPGKLATKELKHNLKKKKTFVWWSTLVAVSHPSSDQSVLLVIICFCAIKALKAQSEEICFNCLTVKSFSREIKSGVHFRSMLTNPCCSFFSLSNMEIRTVLEMLKTLLNETGSSCGFLVSKTGSWLEVSLRWSPSVGRSTENDRCVEAEDALWSPRSWSNSPLIDLW